MKKILLAIATLPVLLLSCQNETKQAGEVRRVEDIFGEILAAVQDTSSSLSSERTVALFNEFADSLYSVIVNTELDDVDPRLEAQKIAGYTLFLAADYGLENGLDMDLCVDKFNKVISTWRIRPTDDSIDYLKEIPYNIRKDSGDEAEREMYIIAKTNYEKPTVILLPKEATGGVLATFVRSLDGGFGYDFENSRNLEGDNGEFDGKYMVYRFDSEEFMEALQAYDALFVAYYDEEGIVESTMVCLGELQKLVNIR